jgi:hypothetical protein
VHPVLDGQAQLIERILDGPEGQIRGLSMRLYDPATRRWRLGFAYRDTDPMIVPVHGGFDRRGRGTFYGRATLAGRTIVVRDVISATSTSARFERALSEDRGVTWTTVWITVDTRACVLCSRTGPD